MSAKYVFSLLVAALAGCQGASVKAPPVEFDRTDLSAYAMRQEDILLSLSRNAGLSGLPGPGDFQWNYVIEAGLNYSQLQCDEFMEALFRWRRQHDFIGRQLDQVQTAANAASLALEIAAEKMGLVGVAFGLAKGTLDNVRQSALVAVEPSGVKATVNNLQQQYRTSVGLSDYRTRGSAVAVMARFHSICLPASIEAEINKKVDDKASKVGGNPDPNGAPIVATPGDVATVEYNYFSEPNKDAIENLLFDAKTNSISANAKNIFGKCLVANGVSGEVSPFVFTSDEQYKPKYAPVLICMRANGLK